MSNTLTLSLPSCVQHAAPTEGVPPGPDAAGLPAVPDGTGQHPPRHAGCAGTQRVSVPVPCCTSHAGNALMIESFNGTEITPSHVVENSVQFILLI